jgi:hypothetical protein
MNEAKPTSANFEIPGFILGNQIGHGGFGVVFDATEESPARARRAIKIIDPSPFQDQDEARRRFDREVEALWKLNHPAIVRYIMSGHTNDEMQLPYIVMEFVEGLTFGEAVSEMSFEERIKAVVQLAEAAEYAHSHQVLHRDIKPSNVVMRTGVGPVLVDFGTSYLWDGLDRETLTKQSPGTLGFIPPEVIANPRRREPLHDVYSLGATLYSAIGGRVPNPTAYESLSKIDAVFGGLDNIVRRAIAADPDARMSTAAQLSQELGRWLATYRHLLTLSVGSSRLFNEAKEAYRKRRLQDAQELADRNARAEAVANAVRSYHAKVCAAAEQAFAEIYQIQAGYGDPQYELIRAETAVSIDEVNAVTPIVTLRLVSDKLDRSLVFAAMPRVADAFKKNRSVVSFDSKPVRHAHGPVVVKKPGRVAGRCWCLFQSGRFQSPPQILMAGLAVVLPSNEIDVMEDAAVLYFQDRRRSGNEPKRLSTPGEIQTGIFECGVSLLGVKLR